MCSWPCVIIFFPQVLQKFWILEDGYKALTSWPVNDEDFLVGNCLPVVFQFTQSKMCVDYTDLITEFLCQYQFLNSTKKSLYFRDKEQLFDSYALLYLFAIKLGHEQINNSAINPN